MTARRARALCPTCNGYGGKCDECNGLRYVPATAATDALGQLVGDSTVRTLEAHMAEVVDWLAELGVLAATRWALEFVPRDPTLGTWERDYVAPGTTCTAPYSDDKADPVKHRRLYTIEVER